MKRIFAWLLAICLTLTVPVVAAEEVPAGTYGVHYVKYGDINCDGSVNAGDALAVLKIAVGSMETEQPLLSAGDVDGTAGVNAGDALRILQVSVGKATGFVPGVYLILADVSDNGTPHTHLWEEWVVVTPATQWAEGKEQRQCVLCDEVEEQTLEKLPPLIGEWEQEILRLVNLEREKEGLDPLSYFVDGQGAADLRAEEIIQVFDHTRPDGSSCFTVLEDFSFYAAGENIAIGYLTPQEVMTGWMNSPGHRSNILSESFTHLVVGAAPVNQDGYRGYAWVQLFLGI